MSRCCHGRDRQGRAPTRRAVTGTHVDEWLILALATRLGERAARMEIASANRCQRIGHLAFDRRESILFQIESRNGAQESYRVGMLRLREQDGSAGALHNA